MHWSSCHLVILSLGCFIFRESLSGEVVGEGQGDGPRTDTGTYNDRQWVSTGQGDRPATDTPTKLSDERADVVEIRR